MKSGKKLLTTLLAICLIGGAASIPIAATEVEEDQVSSIVTHMSSGEVDEDPLSPKEFSGEVEVEEAVLPESSQSGTSSESILHSGASTSDSIVPFAAAPANIELSITNNDGGPLPDPAYSWHSFRINGTFSLPDNTVKEGDTTTIKLPDALSFSLTEQFDIMGKDSNNNDIIVAKATIDAVEKTLTLTYTDFVENHSGVNGSFFFYTQIDTKVVTTEENIELSFKIEGVTQTLKEEIHYKPNEAKDPLPFHKSAWWKQSAPQTLSYAIRVNQGGKEYPNATITDTLQSPGVTYDRDSFDVKKGKWVLDGTEWKLNPVQTVTAAYEPAFSTAKNNDGATVETFTIDLGDIGVDDGFLVGYSTTINYQASDGEKFRNYATLNSNDKAGKQDKTEYRYKVSGGTAEGYVYSINIHKKDKETPSLSLAGAEFDVIRDATGAIVGKVTTDAEGKGSLSGLLKDNYTLKETKAPAGYELSVEEIKISANDFDSTKNAFKEIFNTKATINIEVTKSWDDNNNQDGKRPDSITVNLLADGVQIDSANVTPDAEGNWNYTFTDLPKYKDGNEIAYTITEEPVPA